MRKTKRGFLGAWFFGNNLDKHKEMISRMGITKSEYMRNAANNYLDFLTSKIKEQTETEKEKNEDTVIEVTAEEVPNTIPIFDPPDNSLQMMCNVHNIEVIIKYIIGLFN